MSCNITISTAENVYCASGCDGGSLYHPDQDTAVVKCKIQSYRKIDDLVTPNFMIEFTMDNGMIIVWNFPTQVERDAVWDKVVVAMGGQDMS